MWDLTSFDVFPVIKFVKTSTGPWRILQGPALTTEGKNMKEIIVRGKKVKVPFEDADYRLDGEQDVTIENPLSGEKATVPGYAAAVYDVIQGAQVTHDYDLVQKGCDWFSRHFPKQYMVLLD